MGKKQIKYAQALEELNGILSDLEAEDIDIDDISAKINRATELITICREKIDKTELEVNKIIDKFDSRPRPA